MLTKKLVLFSLLWLSAFPLFAQIDDLLKNKDITWVAEISTDFIVDNPDLAEEKDLNRIRTIKLLPNLKVSGIYDRLEFSYIIHNAIKTDKIRFYADSTCQNRIYAKTLIRLDTVSPCFAPTPVSFVLYQFCEIEDLKTFRVRQIIFYNAKNFQFGLRTLAFAPLQKIINEAGDSIDTKPLCWIKAEDIQKRPQL